MGWIERSGKRLFFENLTNGKASYESLETRDPKINLIGFVLW